MNVLFKGIWNKIPFLETIRTQRDYSKLMNLARGGALPLGEEGTDQEYSELKFKVLSSIGMLTELQRAELKVVEKLDDIAYDEMALAIYKGIKGLAKE